MKRPRLVRLGDVCAQDRKTLKPEEGMDLRYIGLETIEPNTGLFIDGELSKTPEIPKANSFYFGAQHVLFGKLRPYLNKVALPEFTGKCSTEIVPLLPGCELERAYLAYFLRSRNVVKQISAKTAGARMPRADMDFVLGLQIPLPSLDEQRRIVDILSRAEGIFCLRREAEKKAAEVIPALFIDMFGDPATNPKGWDSFRLDELSEISYGIADKLDTSITAKDGVRILTISNILIDGSIDFGVLRFCKATEDQVKKCSIQRGDLLFNWRNGSETHIGKTAIWEGDDSPLHVSFLLRLRPNMDFLNPYFIWAMINLMRSRGYFVSVSRQQINRKFNASELSALILPVPPKLLQDRFAQQLEQLRFIQRQQSVAKTKAEENFNALLSSAFSSIGTTS